MTGPHLAPLVETAWPQYFPANPNEPGIENGWTVTDWQTLDDELAHAAFDHPASKWGVPHDWQLREWLRETAPEFTSIICPDLVRDTAVRYGPIAVPTLNVYTAGGTTAFVDAYLDTLPVEVAASSRPDAAWSNAQGAGLQDTEAAGWATTGWLMNVGGDLFDDNGQIADRITPWVHELGPGSYLWVLAGFTLDEAATLQDSGPPVSQEQLWVMAAVNDTTEPAGR